MAENFLTGDGKDDDPLADLMKAGNKRLIEQQALIGKKQERIQQLGVQINPMDMLVSRINFIVDQLMPPQADDENNFGNQQRIEFEVDWNETLMEILDGAIKFGTEKKLKEGVPDPAAGALSKLLNPQGEQLTRRERRGK